MVGLGNVDNTSDENKPISIATAAALADKAPLANPTFTGTVSGISSNMVGLGNVDNTSDENKPISIATAAALADKAPLANPTFTGTVSGISSNMVGLGNVDNTSDENKPISIATAAALADKDVSASLSNNVLTISQGGVALPVLDFSSLATDIKVDSLSIETGAGQNGLPNDGKNYLVLTKTDGTNVHVDVNTFLADVKLTGMSLIGNTIQASVSDGVTTEHVSLDLSTLLDAKAPLASPTFTGTVSGIDKNMVGLGNVDNTSDENKPISIATAAALADKAPLANPTFTGTVSGIDKNMVGLGNVDNTSDENKPISIATAAALADKAPLANPTFTGTVSGIDTNMITGLEDALNGKQDTITLTTDLSIQKLSVNKGIEWADSEISYLTCVTFSGTTMTVDAKGKGYVPLYVQQNSGSTYSTINLTDMENGAQVIVALYGSGIISSTLEIQVEVEGVFVPKTLKKNFTSDLTWTNTTHVLLAFFKMGDCIYLTGQELS